MKKIISTSNAPSAIGPYSQGVLAEGKTCYVSGQIAINPASGKIEADTIEGQTRQAVANIHAILKEAGMDLEDAVMVTVLLSDISDFSAMNKVYAEYFKKDAPARAAYQVSALPAGAKVEISVIACRQAPDHTDSF